MADAIDIEHLKRGGMHVSRLSRREMISVATRTTLMLTPVTHRNQAQQRFPL